MGNTQGKREQRSGGVSREDDSEIQESNKAAIVPVRDETQLVRLPSAQAEDDEPGGVDEANHCEPLGTTEPTISSPNTWETMPSPNIHTHGRSEDCQGTKVSILAGNSAELRHHRLNPTGEQTKVPNGILPCNDAAASEQRDSNAKQNANYVFMKERLQADCADGFQGKEASPTSESTELRSGAVLSDTSPSIEPTSVMEAESSSSTSTPSPNVNLRESPGSPSSGPSSTSQVPAKKLQKVWGASMLELLTSLAADDVALGADAFRAPEKLDQPPPHTSHDQDNSEDSWRTRCQRILCPPDCAYCQSAISEATEVVEEDQDASNTPEESPVRPADHSAFRNFNFPSSGEEDAERQLALKAMLASLAPARMLKPQVLDTCTWKVPLCKRERCRTSMTPTSTSPEQTNELQTSNFSEPGASIQVPNAVRQLLQQLGMPSQTAVALLDECPIHMDRGGIPSMPASSRVVRSVLEDPAGTRLLFSNVLQFLAQQAASGRSLLSAERSEEELTNLFKRCSEVCEGYQRQLRLLALPCSSEESEHVEPRTLWSPQQVDDVKKEIHSFLQQVQQFSEQAQLFYQQAFTFVTDFKAFQLRVQHLKQAIENVAKTVPQSETLNETPAPRDTKGAQASLDELLGGFPFIESFIRLVEQFSQRLFSPVQVTEASAATERTPSQATCYSEEKEVPQGLEGQCSPQRDGTSRHSDNPPAFSCSTRSQRRGSRESGDVITIAAKEVRCVFVEDFEQQVISKKVCHEASGSSTSSPQNVTRSVLGFPPVTSESPGSFECDSSVSREKPEHQEVLEQVHHGASEGSSSTSAPRNVTPSVFVFPSVTSGGPGSFEGGTSPSHQTPGPSTTQDIVARSSENLTQQFPLEKSQEFAKSSSSQEAEASSEKTELSSDHPPSPNAFAKMWRSFSFRKRSG